MTSDLFFKTFDPHNEARAIYPKVIKNNDIMFEKAARDCLHNSNIKSGKSQEKVIYDYKIIINGKRRGTFLKQSYRSGYQFRTLRQIYNGNKCQFLLHVCHAIKNGRLSPFVDLHVQSNSDTIIGATKLTEWAKNGKRIMQYSRELYDLVKQAADSNGLGLTPAYEVACAKLIKKIGVK